MTDIFRVAFQELHMPKTLSSAFVLFLVIVMLMGSLPFPTASAQGPSPRIAFVDNQGLVQLADESGTVIQQLSSSGMASPPSWSHDGSMLVWADSASGEWAASSTIYLWKNNVATALPIGDKCYAAAFMPGDEQIALLCAGSLTDGINEPSAADLTAPEAGIVSIVNLDGSDFRQVVSPLDAGVIGHTAGARFFPERILVHADGTILVNVRRQLSAYVEYVAPGSTALERVPNDQDGTLSAIATTPTGFVGVLCAACRPHSRSQDPIQVFHMRTDGSIVETIGSVPLTNPSVIPEAMSPDLTQLMVQQHSDQNAPYDLAIMNLNDGTTRPFAEGRYAAWQPVLNTNAGQDAPSQQNTEWTISPTTLPTTAAAPVNTTTSTAPTSGQMLFAAKTQGQWDIYLYDASTQQTQVLFGGPGDQWAPRWYPDARGILFLNDVSGATEVWDARDDFSNPYPLIPAFTDGSEIVGVEWSYTGWDVTVQYATHKSVVNVDRDTYRTVTLWEGSAANNDFSENGISVYVTDNESVPRLVISGPVTQGDLSIEGDAPRVAANAPLIAYQVGERGSRRIRVINVETQQVTYIASSGSDDSGPTITSDGQFVLYVSDVNGIQTVVSVPVSGGTPTPVAIGSYDAVWYLDWRP